MDKIECPICGENMEIQRDTNTYRCVPCGYKSTYNITANQEQKEDDQLSYEELLKAKNDEMWNYGTVFINGTGVVCIMTANIYLGRIPKEFWPLAFVGFVTGFIGITELVRTAKEKNKLEENNIAKKMT